MKTDNVSDATLLFPDTRGYHQTPEDITTKDTIILDKTEVSISSRDTVTNTIRMNEELNDVSTLVERKFNDLSDKVEKSLYNIEDQIIGMQLSNLSGNNVSGKAITSITYFMCRYP